MQSLLCPARASGLKSQGHVVPPTKKKKQPRAPPAIKDDESWFLLEEKLLPGNHVQKTGAHRTPMCLGLLALTNVNTPLRGLQRPPAPDGWADSSAGKTEGAPSQPGT